MSNLRNTILKYLSFSILSKLINLVSSIFILRLILPEELGLYNSYLVYMGYFALTNFGVFNGLNRMLPIFAGQNIQRDKVEKMVSAVFTYVLVSSILVLAISILFFFYSSLPKNLLLAIGLSAPLFIINNHFFPILFRTASEFKLLGQLDFVIALIGLLSLLLVVRSGFEGFLIRMVVLSFVKLVVYAKYLPISLSYNTKFNYVLEFWRSGVHIFLVGLAGTLPLLISKSWIVSQLGAESMGLFSLALMVKSFLGLVNVSFSQVIYARMGALFGSNNSVVYILKSLQSLFFLQVIIAAVLGIVFWYISGPFVVLYLPKYLNGVNAAKFMGILIVVQSLGSITNIYNVVGRQNTLYFSGFVNFSITIIGLFFYESGDALVWVVKVLILANTASIAIALAGIQKLKRVYVGDLEGTFKKV